MSAGSQRALVGKRAFAVAAVARAAEWRESSRCESCGALGFLPCAHRPDGADGPYFKPAAMPFAGHRTVAELWGVKAGGNSGGGGGGFNAADLRGSHTHTRSNRTERGAS